ncbi:MAG: hypothetical protein HRU38_23505 [Saccharospirillaceae bacterium]|nr:hypothetical protein [Pseudomonadales bacterium]NRB81590.1 hypothetical protein [Saccharospirillaceae bacterium]
MSENLKNKMIFKPKLMQIFPSLFYPLMILVVSFLLVFDLMHREISLFLIILCSIFILFVLFLIKLKILNKNDYFSFDGRFLVRGKNENLRIDMLNVKTLFMGLPEQTGVLQVIAKFNAPQKYNKRKERLEEAIVIQIDSNRWIALGLKDYKNDELFGFYIVISYLKSICPNDIEVEKIFEMLSIDKTEKEMCLYIDKMKLENVELNIPSINKLNEPFTEKSGLKILYKKLTYSKLNQIVLIDDVH